MNNDHTCLFQCINISRVSQKQFEPEPQQMFMHEKTCMIPIAYILMPVADNYSS